MTRFPTSAHLVSWAGQRPRTIQSGTWARNREGKPGTPTCGATRLAAAGVAKTATFLGERHARIARRRGPAKAQVATARSIAVIIWHLLNDRDARYCSTSALTTTRTGPTRTARPATTSATEALGYTVTLTQTQTTG